MTIGSTRLFPLLVAFVLAVLTFLLERAVRNLLHNAADAGALAGARRLVHGARRGV